MSKQPSADLGKLLPAGIISAWPEFGDWADDPENIDDWIVGVPTDRTGRKSYVVTEQTGCPSSWLDIANLRDRRLAVALAAHLNTIPRK
jgi:hypothetical protein